jgi:hypothetical protein
MKGPRGGTNGETPHGGTMPPLLRRPTRVPSGRPGVSFGQTATVAAGTAWQPAATDAALEEAMM